MPDMMSENTVVPIDFSDFFHLRDWIPPWKSVVE